MKWNNNCAWLAGSYALTFPGHVDDSCSITMLFNSGTVPSTTVCMSHHAVLQVELRLQKQSAIQWESLESTSSVSNKLVHKMALLEDAGKLACTVPCIQ